MNQSSTDRGIGKATKIKEFIYDANLAAKFGGGESYEPLRDAHLRNYFNSKNTLVHLRKIGLVQQNGAIVDGKRFKEIQLSCDKSKRDYDRRLVQLDREVNQDLRARLRKSQLKLPTQLIQSRPATASASSHRPSR